MGNKEWEVDSPVTKFKARKNPSAYTENDEGVTGDQRETNGVATK
jgi:hypothetical protein